MPINVPASPKVYTTKYNNFRGVDFTSDPTNVWSHRSPNAKNMTPDLSGRPWKRTGWQIVKEAKDFIDTFNTTMGYSEGDPEYYDGRVTPQKTSYFTMGGEDYLSISNNLGLFFYSKFIGSSATDVPHLLYIDGYYGEIGTAKENTKTSNRIMPDANRGFFFEGQGLAGFYIFCIEEMEVNGDLEYDTFLFRFDGEKLRKIDPYVPTIVIGKAPGVSGGTIYESPNILTAQRIVMFHGDGSSKDFYLPELADTTLTFKVETRSGSSWSTTSAYTTSTDSGVTKISFTNAPASDTEDNVRVTYFISGSVPTTSKASLTPGRFSIGTRATQTRTLTYLNNVLQNTTPWIDGSTAPVSARYDSVVPNIVMVNNAPDVDVYLKTDADTWAVVPVGDTNVDASYTAYSNTLSLRVIDPSAYYCEEPPTEYSTPTEISSNVKIISVSGGGGSGEIHALGGGATATIKTVTQQRYATKWKHYPVYADVTRKTYASSHTRNAFEQCIRAHVYGDGLINSVFMTGSTMDAYRSRVWWSAPADPTYFPDTNYFEAGSNDTNVAGLMKVGEYLGVIKQGQSMDSTIYLAYQTKVATGSITEGNTETTTYDDTFAIKSSIGGVGAVSNGAFNILNSEPLFLSKHGIMGIEPRNEQEKQLRNRSFYINKRLVEEGSLSSAFSFVWRNMYILCVNNHCYILDGAQKSSWANEKTNLQYEAYYWDNIPAQCFAKYNEELWFTDHDGRLCKFKPEGEPSSYHDDYDASIPVVDSTVSYGVIPVGVISSNQDIKITVDADALRAALPGTGQYVFSLGSAGYLHRTLLGHDLGNSGHLDVAQSPRAGDSIMSYLHDSEGWHINGEVADLEDYGITITEGEPKLNDTITINMGAPIAAKWTTVFDDDGSAHYFKTLQKKGTMVVLYPQSSTGVEVKIKKDNDPELLVGKATVRGANNEIIAPSDFYLKKKSKKYKRLQIIAENSGFDETFGIDEIIKCYTIGNYSRNR